MSSDFGWEGMSNDFGGNDITNIVNGWNEWSNPSISDYAPFSGEYQGWSVPPAGTYAPPIGAMGGRGTAPPEPPSLLRQLLGGAVGAAPGVLGLIGQLVNGNTQTIKRTTSPQQTQALGAMQPGANALFNAGAANLGALNAGANPLQTQQQSILAALAPQAANLASGNVQIPEALRSLVRQAYEPYVGDIASQAIESARRRGFAGGAELLNTGPAGAIAGPALANASGMEAQSLLNAMLSFPQASANIAGAYNQPTNLLAQVGQGSLMPAANLAAGYNSAFGGPARTEISGNNAAAMGQYAGNALAGATAGYAKPGQDYQNQLDYEKRIKAMEDRLAAMNPQMQNAGSMSGLS